jgi:hypothetical protein
LAAAANSYQRFRERSKRGAVLLAQTRRQSYDEELAALVARPRVRDRIQEHLGHRERGLATDAAIKDTERQRMYSKGVIYQLEKTKSRQLRGSDGAGI